MKVLLLGDTHGSRNEITKAFKLAKQTNCNTIFQLGDFGFWPSSPEGNVFLTYTNEQCSKYGIAFYFLAGNHEQWNDLDIVFATYKTDDDGFYMYGDMRIAPRSHLWHWGGLTFANMSGAFSIDRRFRAKGHGWFPQELPSWDDVDHLKKLLDESLYDHVDIMLTHDAPVNLHSNMGNHQYVFDHPEAFLSQEIISSAVETIKPTALVHGHWHMSYQYYFDTTYCIGLDQTTGGSHFYSNITIDFENKILERVYMNTNQTVFEFLP